MNIKAEFLAMLDDHVAALGTELEESHEAIAQYMSERATHLSTILGEPGFAQAVTAERNNVALRAGISLSDTADGVDQQLLGLLGAALRIAAAALV